MSKAHKRESRKLKIADTPRYGEVQGRVNDMSDLIYRI
jgi:hypothetical protein